MTVSSRFWWRALDAHMPAEPRPAPLPPSEPVRYAKPAVTKPAAAAVPSLRLEIPKSDRRPARRRRSKQNAGQMLAAVAMILACSAGTGAAYISGAIEPQQLRILVSGEVQNALLGLGFGIDQVSVAGHHYTSDNDIYDALDLASARTFAAFDATAALKRLQALPWVETAQITRLFPGALHVDIRERRPAALWTLKGQTYLIDGTGRVLGATTEPHGWSLPRLSGEGANAEANLLFTALGRQPEIAAAVDHAERIGGRRWSLILKNGSRLELAADREIEGLEEIAANSELKRALAGRAMIADVRTPGRLTIRQASTSMERRP